jgi:hypothetical protein
MAGFCTNCGAPLEAATKFCAQCGTQVEDGEYAAQSQTTVVPQQPTPVYKSGSYGLLWGTLVAVVVILVTVSFVFLRSHGSPKGQTIDAGTWLGFANETSPQDREMELHQNCGADFRRVYVPLESGNKFTDLCRNVGKTCERVCDWQGSTLPCNVVSQGGQRDGSRIALCRR